MTANPTGGSGHIYEWLRTSPNPSNTPVSTTATFDFGSIVDIPSGAKGETYSFSLRVEGETTGGDPTSADRRTQLLNLKQPGTNMFARTGFGQFATGGSNPVTVDNLEDLIQQCKVSGNYISIVTEDTKWYQDHGDDQIHFSAPNITLDGRDAPNLVIHNRDPNGQSKKEVKANGKSPLACSPSVRMTQDNIILHNLSFEGPSTNVANDGGDALTGCISYINCTNAWMDHVTIRNFKHDDSITFGQSSVGNDAKD